MRIRTVRDIVEAYDAETPLADACATPAAGGHLFHKLLYADLETSIDEVSGCDG